MPSILAGARALEREHGPGGCDKSDWNRITNGVAVQMSLNGVSRDAANRRRTVAPFTAPGFIAPARRLGACQVDSTRDVLGGNGPRSTREVAVVTR